MRTNLALTMPWRDGTGDWLSQPFGVIARWQARARERAALGRLDDRMLRDIGVDRATAHYEVTKPFWVA